MAMAANVCDNCEGTEFELLDGHYFCKICSVQSQQLIEVEAGFSQMKGDGIDGAHDFTPSQGAAKHYMKAQDKVKRMVDLAKEIPPIDTLSIVKTVLRKYLEVSFQHLGPTEKQEACSLAWKVWGSYEEWMLSTSPEAGGGPLGRHSSLRDFFFHKHKDKFYLLYLYDFWLRRLTLRLALERRKDRRKKSKLEEDDANECDNEFDGDELDCEENEIKSEMDVLLDEMMKRLIRENQDSDSEPSSTSNYRVVFNSSATSAKEAKKFSLHEFICGMKLNRNSRSSWSLLHFDETEIEVLEDAHEWNKQFNRKIGAKKSSPNNQLENELKKQLDEENEEKFVPLEEEENEFRKARFQVSDHNGSYRPLPRVALSIVYMVSTLLNRQVFILEIIQKMCDNEIPLLDLTSWEETASVVLTPPELTLWAIKDISLFPLLLRRIAARLYKIAFADSKLDVIILNDNDVYQKCEWTLQFLNLPLSLAPLCNNLMDTLRRNMCTSRNKWKMLVEFDVYFFAIAFIVKHFVIDQSVHPRMKQFSRQWYKSAHRTLFERGLPPYLLMLGHNLSFLHKESKANFFKMKLHLNTLAFRDRFHNYRRLWFPPWAQKRLILWEMLRGNANAEKDIEDYCVFIDKPLKTILQTSSKHTKTTTTDYDDEEVESAQFSGSISEERSQTKLSEYVQEFKYQPDFRKAVFKMNSSYLCQAIENQCIQLATSKGSKFKVALINEQMMYYGFTNSLFEKRSFPDVCEIGNADEMCEDVDPGVSMMGLESDPRMGRTDEHEGSIVVSFKEKEYMDLDEKKGLESFGIYDELFCLGATVGGQDFRRIVRICIENIGKTSFTQPESSDD